MKYSTYIFLVLASITLGACDNELTVSTESSEAGEVDKVVITKDDEPDSAPDAARVNPLLSIRANEAESLGDFTAHCGLWLIDTDPAYIEEATKSGNSPCGAGLKEIRELVLAKYGKKLAPLDLVDKAFSDYMMEANNALVQCVRSSEIPLEKCTSGTKTPREAFAAPSHPINTK